MDTVTTGHCGAMMQAKKKASEIYKKQNTIIHKAMSRIGMPYGENKGDWLNLFGEIAGREVGGLSELTLAERHEVIVHLRRKGLRLFSPTVPARIRDWKKGDEDIAYEYRVDDDPQIRMVYAMWVEMGYQPKSLRGLCLKRFKKDDPRWLSNEELSQLVNLVKYRAERKGYGSYYRRGYGA